MSSSASIPPHPFPASPSGLNRTEMPRCPAPILMLIRAAPGRPPPDRRGGAADAARNSASAIAPVSFGKLWCESCGLRTIPPLALPSRCLPNKKRRHKKRASRKAACAASPPPQGFAPTETVGARCACVYILQRSGHKNNGRCGIAGRNIRRPSCRDASSATSASAGRRRH